ncbi:hypothetical protein QTJ16_005285 [Diplocarpon rosae]|uniref:Transthyretin/hydroxyisourate hydrolase domain-containing protein n=1 Tax=Diplocarpon rosae TaxID=946125 RepID=A0AAD9WD08_9HELO|nr:hypothetical protein QTJ16_005285 [Diplocarpon rosae]
MRTLVQRITALTSQLQIPIVTMSCPERPPITCHVLDTIAGRPAAGLDVKLFCTELPSVVFEARTNADGRVAAWEIQLAADEREGEYARENWGPAPAMKKIIEERGLVEESQSRPLGTSLWKLQFNTGAHYGVANTFFPVRTNLTSFSETLF